MAQVASCPQCHQELLVPEGASGEAWAKCPECLTFFQVQQTSSRELPALVLLDSAPQASETKSAPTVADLSSAVTWTEPSSDESETRAAGDVDAEAEIAAPRPDENLDSAAQRIEAWFRSTKGVPDSSDIEPPQLGELTSAAKDLVRSNAEAFGEPSAAAPLADDGPKFVTPVVGPRRRKRSFVRTLAMTLLSGVIGLGLGYYALLWMRGESGDFLNLARYLPEAALPAEFQAAPKPLATNPRSKASAVDETSESGAESALDATGKAAESQAAHTKADEPIGVMAPDNDRNSVAANTSPSPAGEPAELDVSAARPLAKEGASSNAIRIANAPSFTLNDLASALQAAKDAQPSLVTGSLSDGKEVQNAKGHGYRTLADLAQKATFVDGASNSDSVGQLQRAAEELFHETLANPHTREEVAQIVPMWLTSPNRKHGGVFFAASLTRQDEKSGVVEWRAELTSGQSLTILAPATLADRISTSGRTVGIVGWIVDRPAEQVPGYAGEDTQAIWVGQFISLE